MKWRAYFAPAKLSDETVEVLKAAEEQLTTLAGRKITLIAYAQTSAFPGTSLGASFSSKPARRKQKRT